MNSPFVCKEYQQSNVCKLGNKYFQLRYQVEESSARCHRKKNLDCTDHFDHIIRSCDLHFPSTEILRGNQSKENIEFVSPVSVKNYLLSEEHK